MTPHIIRYNEGRQAGEPQKTIEPDLSVQWQEYTLSFQEVGGDPSAAHPGLYRDGYGDTWLKAGDGSIHKLGASSAATATSTAQVTENAGGGVATQEVVIPDNSLVTQISIYNEIGWDQASATIEIGLLSDADRFFTGRLKDPGQVGLIAPYYRAGVGERLLITVTAGATATPTGVTNLSMTVELAG